jgi:uncharacterized protein (TIGR02246 family)
VDGPNSPEIEEVNRMTRTPSVRPARSPEELHAIVADAFNHADLDALIAVHADDAALVVPMTGEAVHGLDAIRDAVAPLFAMQPHMDMELLRELDTGDLALTHGKWRLVIHERSGEATELNGCGTMVSERGPDGSWRIVLDDPMSPLSA